MRRDPAQTEHAYYGKKISIQSVESAYARNMIQTARMLRGIPGKTIVLTGSMQPARFRSTDATFNIGLAIGAVQTLPSGVYLAMSGRIFDPENTRKNSAESRSEEF